MDRKSTYSVLTMTEKKYQDNLSNSFGLGLTNRISIIGQLGLKSTKVNDKMLMTRVLESVKWSDNVGLDFKEKKLHERKELNQVNLLRSVRFLNGLPCHGQRTQTNAGTSKRRAGKKRGGNIMKKKSSWRLRLLARRRRGDNYLKSWRRLSRIKFVGENKISLKQTTLNRWVNKSYRKLSLKKLL